MVCRGCVLFDWESRNQALLKDAVQPTQDVQLRQVSQPQTKHCLHCKAGPHCILGYVGPRRIHLIQPSILANKGLTFEGVFKLGQSCRAECDIVDHQMQLTKDAALNLDIARNGGGSHREIQKFRQEVRSFGQEQWWFKQEMGGSNRK